MRRVIPLLGIGLILSASAEPVFAQQRLFALLPSEIVELDTSSQTFGQVRHRAPVPSAGASGYPAVSAAGGSLLAWDWQFGVVLYDTARGSLVQGRLPGFFVERVLGTDASSYRLLLLGSFSSPTSVLADRIGVVVADLRLGSTRLIDLGAMAGPIAYAHRADVLFVSRGLPGFLHPRTSVDVISVNTGALLKSLPIAPTFVGDLTATSDGTRLFVGNLAGGLSVLDVASNTMLATNAAIPGLASRSAALIDEARGRVLVPSPGRSEARLEAFAADTLVSLGSADLPRLTVPNGYPQPIVRLNADVSDRSATIFAFETVASTDELAPPCGQSALAAIDVDRGNIRRTVDLSAVTGTNKCSVDLVRVTEPAAPAGFNGAVTGNRVALTWAPEGATHYELEVGTAPGLANLANIKVTDTQLVVDGVPSGVYHLRVRAINTIGKSAPSQDIRVVVQ